METPADTEETLPVIVTTELTSVSIAEPTPFPVTVNDIVFDKAPERIISLSPSLTEILFEMGYGDKIVGRGSYCDYPPEIEGTADAGRPSKPDLDTIIAIKPDVLFTATSIPVKDKYKLEENGIKIVYIPYPESIEEFQRIYSAFGLIFEGIFDGEEVGKKSFSDLQNSIDSANIELGKFVYITEGMTIATGDTFESSFLSFFGTNIGADGKGYGYPKEYLTEFQPDVIILNDNYTVDDLLADEIYSTLNAVTEGKVYCISNTYFERPSKRITELIEELSAIGG